MVLTYPCTWLSCLAHRTSLAYSSLTERGGSDRKVKELIFESTYGQHKDNRNPSRQNTHRLPNRSDRSHLSLLSALTLWQGNDTVTHQMWQKSQVCFNTCAMHAYSFASWSHCSRKAWLTRVPLCRNNQSGCQIFGIEELKKKHINYSWSKKQP